MSLINFLTRNPLAFAFPPNLPIPSVEHRQRVLPLEPPRLRPPDVYSPPSSLEHAWYSSSPSRVMGLRKNNRTSSLDDRSTSSFFAFLLLYWLSGIVLMEVLTLADDKVGVLTNGPPDVRPTWSYHHFFNNGFLLPISFYYSLSLRGYGNHILYFFSLFFLSLFLLVYVVLEMS